MTELSFPLEREQNIKLLGMLLTGVITGRILSGTLIMIGLFFMNSMQFAPISLVFFVVFIAPMALLLYRRMVTKGKQLMKPWCDIIFKEESKMELKTGYPNTMDPNWREIEITDENRDIYIRGSEETGFQLQLSGDAFPDIRIGLWVNKENAEKAADELKIHLKGKIREFVKVKTTSQS